MSTRATTKAPANSKTSSDDSHPSGAPETWFQAWGLTIIASLSMAALCALVAWWLHGKFGLEKTLTWAVKPFGLFWLLFTGNLFANLVRRGLRGNNAVLAVAWLWITCCSLKPVADTAIAYLESQVEVPQLSASEPLNAVVVLGGGTIAGPQRSQAADAGDRVLYGAELYLGGFTRTLVTTGTAVKSIDGSERKSPSVMTNEIWTALGIEEDRILQLPGRNTYEEMQSIEAAFNDGRLTGSRVGILTSATHLPRAMRLARSRNLDLIPLAADFRVSTQPTTFMDYLPSDHSIRLVTTAQHEFLAAIFRR